MERLHSTSASPPWIQHEHAARFHFASAFLKGGTVVDCACGEGVGSKVFAEATSAAVWAFDQSEEAIARAQRYCSSPNVVFAVAEATRLSLPDHSVDVYISLETIEHLEDDAAFLTEAVRVLKPAGHFICSTPNRTVTNPCSSITDKPFNPHHLREYTTDEFSTLLSRYFRQVQLFGQNPQTPWRLQIAERLSSGLGCRLAVRFNQVLKLPYFVYDSVARHVVMPLEHGIEYEYLVAVCSSSR